MRISVRLFTALREIVGKSEETIEFDVEVITVKNVLGELVKRHGRELRDYIYDKRGIVGEHLQILVNGKSVSLLEELDTRLKAGDQIAIVPPVGGG